MAVGIECPKCGFPLTSGFCPYCTTEVRPVGHINEATRRLKAGVAGFAALALLVVLAYATGDKEK